MRLLLCCVPCAGAACEFSGPRDFAAGDVVVVELDRDVLKLLQNSKGLRDDFTFEVCIRAGCCCCLFTAPSYRARDFG